MDSAIHELLEHLSDFSEALHKRTKNASIILSISIILITLLAYIYIDYFSFRFIENSQMKIYGMLSTIPIKWIKQNKELGEDFLENKFMLKNKKY